MKMLSVFFILALASQTVTEPNWQPITDPLAPSREGKLYCQSPNLTNKTCSGISSYRVTGDGIIIGHAVGALNNDPPMSFVIEANTEVKDGALCFALSQRNLDEMYLMIGDQRFESEEGDKLLALRRESMAEDLLEKEVCEQHFSDGDRRTLKAFVDGVEVPEMSGEYVLITESSGYRLHTSYPLFGDAPSVGD
jgi:hypothetical protein